MTTQTKSIARWESAKRKWFIELFEHIESNTESIFNDCSYSCQGNGCGGNIGRVLKADAIKHAETQASFCPSKMHRVW